MNVEEGRKPKVWIIKEQVKRGETGPEVVDYSPAMRYGEIEFITQHDFPLYPKSSIGVQWDAQVAEFLQKYDDSQDYIVLTGQPLAIFLVGFIMALKRKAPRFLVWRREQGGYVFVDPLPKAA